MNNNNNVNSRNVYVQSGTIKINDDEYKGNENLENIVLPNTLTHIGDRAFFGCKNLKNIVLPSELVSMGRAAFYYCKGIKNIVIPKGIRKIEKEAFLDCSLTNVIFSNSLEYIDELAFAYNNLATVELPYTVRKISHGSFYKTRHLIAYNNIEGGLEYAMHNLKPGLAVSAIPWLGHRLTIKDAITKDIIFSIYIAGSYWIPARNKVLALYSGGEFDIEGYDKLFETIRSIDDRAYISLLRLQYPYKLSKDAKDMYIEDLRKNAVKVVQKVIYDNDITLLKQCDTYGLIDEENIDVLLMNSYEKHINVEIRAYLMSKKSAFSSIKKDSLYL